MLSERPQTTLHKKILRNFALILLGQIAQVKTLCSVALEAPDNFA